MPELKHKLFYQSALSASQVLFPLLTFPYVSRVLGPEGLGKVSYTDMLVQIFVTFALFGIPFYAIREIARIRDNTIQRSQLSYELLWIHSLFSILAVVIFTLLTFHFRQQEPLLFTLAAANLLIMPFMSDWYLHGMEAFRYMAIRNIIPRVIAVVSIFFLVKTQSDYSTYYAILTASVIVTAFFSIYKLWKDNPYPSAPLQWRKHIKPLSYFFLTTCAFSIYIFFDTVILAKLTNAETVGYYSTGLKIAKLCLIAFLVLSDVFLPRISNLLANHENEKVNEYFNRSLQAIVTLSIPMGAGLFLLAPEIISVMSGQQYGPSILVLQILSPLPLLIGLSNLFGIQMLVPLRKEKLLLFAAVAGCVISLSLNFLLIPSFKERGAAVANVTTELVVTVLVILFAIKSIRVHLKSNSLVAAIACSLLFIPLCWVARMYIDNVLVRLLIVVPFAALLYFYVQQKFFRNPVMADLFSFFTQKK